MTATGQPIDQLVVVSRLLAVMRSGSTSQPAVASLAVELDSCWAEIEAGRHDPERIHSGVVVPAVWLATETIADRRLARVAGAAGRGLAAPTQGPAPS